MGLGFHEETVGVEARCLRERSETGDGEFCVHISSIRDIRY